MELWDHLSPPEASIYSEIDGHISDTRSVDENKEEISYKHVSQVALFSRYVHFKCQDLRRAASC
jgi:hypothetical protein